MALMSAFTSGSVPEHGEESHTDSGVTAGLYSWPVTFTVNAAGHLTQAARSYDNTLTYAAHALVIGSDSNIYRAKTTTVGNDPTTNDGDEWELLIVTANTTLSVAAAGRFTTPSAAYAFVKNAIIHDGAAVTISIAAGTFTESAAIEIASPYGSRLGFAGAGSGSTTVHFNTASAGTSGFVILTGCALGSSDKAGLASLTIKGTWTGDASTTGSGKSAIFVSQGGAYYGGSDVKVLEYYYGVNASGAAYAQGMTVTTCGDAGFHSFRSGHVDCSSSTVTGAGDSTNTLGAGAAAERGGTIIADGITCSSCLLAGLYVPGGTMRADTYTLNSNDLDGIRISAGGRFSSSGTGTADSCGGIGLNVQYGTAHLSGTSHSFDSNTSHGIYIAMGSSVQIRAATTCSSNGGSGIRIEGGDLFQAANITCNSNTSHGMQISACGRLGRASGVFTANSNTIDGVRLSIMSIADLTSAVLGNTGAGNGGVGLNAFSISRGSASGATIRDNVSFGGAISDGAYIIVTDANVTNNNGGGGVEFSPNTEDADAASNGYIRTL